MLFIGKALLPLTMAGSQALSQVVGKSLNYYNKPIILARDFIINPSRSVTTVAIWLFFGYWLSKGSKSVV